MLADRLFKRHVFPVVHYTLLSDSRDNDIVSSLGNSKRSTQYGGHPQNNFVIRLNHITSTCLRRVSCTLLRPLYGIGQAIIYLPCGFFFLWPQCVADADIIFLSCGLFFLSSFFLSSFFIPRLISAVADGMSTILRHMMWS